MGVGREVGGGYEKTKVKGREPTGTGPIQGPVTTLTFRTTNWSTHCRARGRVRGGRGRSDVNHACESIYIPRTTRQPQLSTNEWVSHHIGSLSGTGQVRVPRSRSSPNTASLAFISFVEVEVSCDVLVEVQQAHHKMPPRRHDTSSMLMCHANPVNGHRIALYRNGYMAIRNVPMPS